MAATTLILIHPREIVRRGFLSVLQNRGAFKVVGEGCNGREAGILTKQHEPDLILIYDQLEAQDSFDVTKKLIESNPDIKVIMISVEPNTTYMARASAVGASHFLLEGISARELTAAIGNAAAGKHSLGSGAYAKVTASMSAKGTSATEEARLTPRESQVLSHVAFSLSHDEIA